MILRLCRSFGSRPYYVTAWSVENVRKSRLNAIGWPQRQRNERNVHMLCLTDFRRKFIWFVSHSIHTANTHTHTRTIEIIFRHKKYRFFPWFWRKRENIDHFCCSTLQPFELWTRLVNSFKCVISNACHCLFFRRHTLAHTDTHTPTSAAALAANAPLSHRSLWRTCNRSVQVFSNGFSRLLTNGRKWLTWFFWSESSPIVAPLIWRSVA